jgi:hypothetical protein
MHPSPPQAPGKRQRKPTALWLESRDQEDLERTGLLSQRVVPQLLQAHSGELPVEEAVFCVCRRPYADGDEMVACDGCSQWFHPRCIGLLELPRCKKWYCDDCGGVQHRQPPRKRPAKVHVWEIPVTQARTRVLSAERARESAVRKLLSSVVRRVEAAARAAATEARACQQRERIVQAVVQRLVNQTEKAAAPPRAAGKPHKSAATCATEFGAGVGRALSFVEQLQLSLRGRGAAVASLSNAPPLRSNAASAQEERRRWAEWAEPSVSSIEGVNARLRQSFGPRRFRRGTEHALNALLGTVLTQNTSDIISSV